MLQSGLPEKAQEHLPWDMSEAVSLYGHIHFLIIFPDFPGPHSDSKSLPRGPPTLPRTPPSSRATIPRTESFRLTHAMHTPMHSDTPIPTGAFPFMTDMFTMLTPMLNLRFGLTYKYAIHFTLTRLYEVLTLISI